MNHDPEEMTERGTGSPAHAGGDPASMSTTELLAEIARQVSQLARTELDLAKNELRADLLDEVKMATGLSLAAILALMAVNLLLVTAVLALATVLPGWVAGAIVTGVVALGAVGGGGFRLVETRATAPGTGAPRDGGGCAMGQEPHGIDKVGQAGKTAIRNRRCGVWRTRADAIRGNLDVLVDEAERRGSRLVKPIALGTGIAALVVLPPVAPSYGAGAFDGARRRRGCVGWRARCAGWSSTRTVVAEAEEPSLSKKILASAGAALASIAVHQLARVAMSKFARPDLPPIDDDTAGA